MLLAAVQSARTRGTKGSKGPEGGQTGSNGVKGKTGHRRRAHMSNKTVKGAHQVHGKDPQLLVEKITRERIYESLYWKEECFGLTAETILDRAVELTHVGGTFGNQRPVPFLCLVLKLLQIQPTLPIIDEYIIQEDFKYLRVLALFYLRLVAPSAAVYTKLEPFLADRRKLRIRLASGEYALTYVDQVVDQLLTEDRVFGIILPRLTKRAVLEDAEELAPRPLFFPIDAQAPLLAETVASRAVADLAESPDDARHYRDRESLSVEETNALRARLGLAPLSS